VLLPRTDSPGGYRNSGKISSFWGRPGQAGHQLFAFASAAQKRQIIVKRNAPYRDRAFSNTEKDQYPLGGLVITGLYLAGSKYNATAQ